jgi:SAM-dependent methyltransferase
MAWVAFKKGFHKVLPGLTIQPKNRVDETLKMLPKDAKICDIGAGGRKITPDIYTIDGYVTQNTDLVCDIHDIPLSDESFDCIFCTGTLEHVEDPHKALHEIFRLLKKDGVAHIEVPFIQGYHADPNDYWRWTIEGLRLFCSKAGFSEIVSGSHIGPTSSLNWILNEYIICLLGNGLLGNIMSFVTRLAVAPMRYMDYLLIKKDSSMKIASGIYFTGRK